MQLEPDNLRVLSLDLRTRRFGFAVLEGPQTLLEWGTRRSRREGIYDSELFIRRQLASLLTRYAPSVVVLKRASRQGGGRNSRHAYLLKTVTDEARQQGVEVVIVGRNEIKTAFKKEGRTTKETIASKIALSFPQLTWSLPPVRKPWANESHTMIVFDAISLGLTYLARFGDALPHAGGRSASPPPG